MPVIMTVPGAIANTVHHKAVIHILFISPQQGTNIMREGCQYLKKSSIPIDINQAISQGYTPCSRCNP
nr:MAG TPA: DNA methyl phosphotriester repair domain protein [Ackermannviridae sp.]